jgi:hypothetical protein
LRLKAREKLQDSGAASRVINAAFCNILQRRKRLTGVDVFPTRRTFRNEVET